MLLQDKTVVIYGGAGAVGYAVAEAFAKEGCIVCLAGRTSKKLEAAAEKIRKIGGKVETKVVDAMVASQVEEHLTGIIKRFGKLDISFNAISTDDIQGYSLTEMAEEDFYLPIKTAMHSYFITATAAARKMRVNKSGVILALTANAGKKPYEHSGGFGVSCAAIEALCRQLAIEEGKHGIRVICMRSAGSPDAPGVDEVFNQHAEKAGMSREQFENEFAQRTMLKRLPRLAEIANAAILVASDKASAITAAVINVTCGELAD